MSPQLSALPVLILCPHSRCNCRCLMCDIWKTEASDEISAAQLEAHLADIERLHVEWVVFSGGEPLMHSDLFRLAALLRARGIRITLLSTGLLLERYAARIAESIDDVIVSLDGPPAIHDRIRRVTGAFDKLATGVRALRGVPVAARSVVQRANHAHLRDTVQTARELGLASLSFLAADLTSTAFNRLTPWPPERQDDVALSAAELPALRAEIEALIAAQDPSVVESAPKLRRIVQHFEAHLGLVAAQAPRCNAPWVSAVVEAGGMVRPCFFHAPIGNIHQTPLLEIINGPTAAAFRARLDVASHPICRRCVCSLHYG